MSHKKALLTVPSGMDSGKADALKTKLAELLGLECDDVVVLPGGVTLQLVEGAAPKAKKEPHGTPEKTK